MKKVKDDIKAKIKERYEFAVNSYLLELLNMWELAACYGYWIGDDVGGVYDYGGMFTINMGDIIYCVEHDVTYEQYMELQEYVCDAAEFGFDMPNLRSWMMGCPRTDEETFKKLREMKKGLEKAIEIEKERIKNSKNPVRGK